MLTGRKLIERALREPMQAIGWKPRAGGWFTLPITPEYTGVAAASAFSAYTPAGTAETTLFVHLRREDVQPVVRELVESPYADGGYRSATATTSIGYLMPEPTWRTWLVTPKTVASVAAELAAATRDHAQPYLERLAADPTRFVEAVKTSAIKESAMGMCTIAVVLARMGRPDEGWAIVQQHVSTTWHAGEAARTGRPEGTGLKLRPSQSHRKGPGREGVVQKLAVRRPLDIPRPRGLESDGRGRCPQAVKGSGVTSALDGHEAAAAVERRAAPSAMRA